MNSTIKNYSGILLLLSGIVVGSILGIFFPEIVTYIKPIGDIFLNLLFVAVVPMVYFAVANSIASVKDQGKFGKILGSMIFTFLLFIVIAAIYTIVVVYFFPTQALPSTEKIGLDTSSENSNWGNKIVDFFTVSEFTQLFSRQNMLALLIFAFLNHFYKSKIYKIIESS